MKAVSNVCSAVCFVCIAVSILSALIPQKRTSKIYGFVIGLFVISSIIGAVRDNPLPDIDISDTEKYIASENDGRDIDSEALRLTADNLVKALNELLLSEGIRADDIRLSLKITDEGRIYAERVVIYINEAYITRGDEIKRTVYGNLAKEPEIYVTGQTE